jgi:plasmid stabilization system protein ParE
MSSRAVRFAVGADDDLARLYGFLAEKDVKTAERALLAIRKGLALAAAMPFSCRRAADSTVIRECVISFGRAGYVVAFEVAGDHIMVLADRHQREDDFH